MIKTLSKEMKQGGGKSSPKRGGFRPPGGIKIRHLLKRISIIEKLQRKK